MKLKRVLMVSPHFPPDTGAATHRVRLLAPYLAEFGWEPTIVTVDPRDYEGRLDPSLLALVPADLRVIRVRALSPRWTRITRFGDLGIRSFRGLLTACGKLVRSERFDCFFVTIFPSYPALLGPLLKRRARIPFVLDYQDPWVGAWGLTTGPGTNGSPDLKSRVSRRIASWLEPVAVRSSDGITAVSRGTFEAICSRIPDANAKPFAEIPIGGDAADFDYLRSHPREAPLFASGDGHVHVSYVGTLLPLGLETLRSFLGALVLLKHQNRTLFDRLRVHFIGTSNQTVRGENRVIPEAQRLGVAEVVREVPERVDYLDALEVLRRSETILLLGSSEPHYSASKIYPALLARRPLLAIFHRASSVVPILERAADAGPVKIVTYDDHARAETFSEVVFEALLALLDAENPEPHEGFGLAEELSARSLASRLARFLDQVAATNGS